MWFNCVEEMIFTDEDFCHDPEDNRGAPIFNFTTDISRIQALQAAYMVCLYQGWEGTEASKRRIRRFRFSTVISVMRYCLIIQAEPCTDDYLDGQRLRHHVCKAPRLLYNYLRRLQLDRICSERTTYKVRSTVIIV